MSQGQRLVSVVTQMVTKQQLWFPHLIVEGFADSPEENVCLPLFQECA